jgi:hypothetical protein
VTAISEPRASTVPARPSSWSRVVLALAAESVRHPSLAVDLVRVAWRFRRRRWYTRPPFLPLPSRTYLRWRMYTAFGDEQAVPPARDVIRYARWAARQR